MKPYNISNKLLLLFSYDEYYNMLLLLTKYVKSIFIFTIQQIITIIIII